MQLYAMPVWRIFSRTDWLLFKPAAPLLPGSTGHCWQRRTWLFELSDYL